MTFTKLVPHILYQDIQDALVLFEEHLELSIEHQYLVDGKAFYGVSNGQLRINLFQNKSLAKEHNPGCSLKTDDIKKRYNITAASHPGLLHPGLPDISLRACGAKEFAIKNKQPGIVIKQWP